VVGAKTVMGTDMTMLSVTENRLSLLRRARARLAEQIDVCEGSRDVALLVARLQSVLAEIAALEPGDGLSAADEIARRRQERRGKGLRVSIEHAQGVGREHR
jgi:predicted TIM-barrel fold metal-dependent hydrolase